MIPTEVNEAKSTISSKAAYYSPNAKVKPIGIQSCGVEMAYKSGRQSVKVLENINFEVEQGDIQLLMGPSGSGKTTLLSIIAGLLTPTAGKVFLLGEEITKLSRTQLAEFRLHNIGFIFQGFNLFPALTALENVELALNLKGIRGKIAREEAKTRLEQVGLQDKINLLPQDLSGGQKQRVAVARALTGEPPLIMADEPTAALDSSSGRGVIDLLKTLAKQGNTTVLMVTHDPRIMDVADSILTLEDGRIKN